MAYTRAWDEAVPTSGIQASTLSTEIDHVKTDLKERLLALLTNMTDDPVVPLALVTGKIDGLKLWIPGSSFVPSTTSAGALGNESSYWDHNLGAITGGLYRMAPVMVPRGVVITQIDVVAMVLTSGSASCALKHIDTTGGVGSATPSWTTDDTLVLAFNANGFFNLYTKVINVTVIQAWYQLFYAGAHTSDAIIGAVLTYNRPSHLVG